MPLPKDVIEVKRRLEKDDFDKLRCVADKLIADSPELISMWRTLKRREDDLNDSWVWDYLRAVKEASTLPAFHYASRLERQELSDKIGRDSRYLSDILKHNNLDGQLFYDDGKMFPGFYIDEDFGESNQSRINNAEIPKIPVSLVIQRIAERAKEKIAEEPMPGKSGKNVRAIRFIRIIAARNQRVYETPLHFVTAIAANGLFKTKYRESDVVNLLNR